VSNWPVNTTETFDFLVSLKGGSQGAALYFFDNVSFDGSGGGSWSVSFLNSGGQTPNLSNLRVFGRAGSCVTNCGEGGGDDNFEVPAPGTLALAGLALLGVAAAGRRRRS
jgi:MYXO-CTERM domain-containing protein